MTRSGNNQWHGTGFEYFRNNPWTRTTGSTITTAARAAAPAERFRRQLGGPVDIPGFYNGKIRPSFSFRTKGCECSSPKPRHPIMSLMLLFGSRLPALCSRCLTRSRPHTERAGLGNGLGEFIGTWSNPARIDSYSIRLDHAVNENLKLFFRFSDAPSSSATRGTGFFGATPSMNSLHEYSVERTRWG